MGSRLTKPVEKKEQNYLLAANQGRSPLLYHSADDSAAPFSEEKYNPYSCLPDFFLSHRNYSEWVWKWQQRNWMFWDGSSEAIPAALLTRKECQISHWVIIQAFQTIFICSWFRIVFLKLIYVWNWLLMLGRPNQKNKFLWLGKLQCRMFNGWWLWIIKLLSVIVLNWCMGAVVGLN